MTQEPQNKAITVYSSA